MTVRQSQQHRPKTLCLLVGCVFPLLLFPPCTIRAEIITKEFPETISVVVFLCSFCSQTHSVFVTITNYSKKLLTRVSKGVPGAHGKRGLERGLAEKVGKGLAKGWRRVGEGLAKG